MRKLCWFGLPFAAAVFGVVYLLPEEWLLMGAALCALCSLLGLAFRGRRRKAILLALLGLAAGLGWCAGWNSLFRAPLVAMDERETAFTAVVADYSRTTDYGGSVLVKAEFPDGVRGRVLLHTDERMEVKPGDALSGTVALLRTDRYGDGSRRDGYSSRGIFLTGRLTSDPLTVEHCERTPLRFLPARWAAWWREGAAAAFPGDVLGLMTALTTGDREGLSDHDYAALKRSGLAHTVAVSGMHISVLVGMVVFLLGKGRRRTALLGILLSWVFACLTGASPSAIRAAILQTFLLSAPLLGREEDPPTMLTAALLALLAWNPWSAASISLQLSFLSVAGIYLFSGRLWESFTAKLPHKPKTLPGKLAAALARLLAAGLAASLSAMALTLPLIAWQFGSISLISPVSNLLALWAVTLAFQLGLPAVLLTRLLPAAGAALGSLAAWPARWVLFAAHACAKVPFASVGTSFPYMVVWLALLCAVMAICLFAKTKPRLRVVLPALGLTLIAALAFPLVPMPGGAVEVSVLDVGQGLSVALRTAGSAVLVDCGGDAFSRPGDIAADHFAGLGVDKLDILVLTHFHADHVNGVGQLLDRMEVGRIIVPDTQRDESLRTEILALAGARGTEVLFLSDDTTLELPGAALKLFAPLGDGGTNEEGLSALFTCGTFDALITGDMNAVVERRLIKYGGLPDIELLAVGHHGSKTSTCEELLAETMPEKAVISVGRNSYGHPAGETLARLSLAGCDIYRTDTMGTVTVTARTTE